jgi:hypothetical protein
MHHIQDCIQEPFGIDYLCVGFVVGVRPLVLK